MPRRALLVSSLLAVASVVLAAFLGESYISRLPNHAGYFLVAVDDHAEAPDGWRPRRTAFIVVDGLRRDAAERMNVTAELERRGQCRISDQGSYTVSRPEYALLSTGLEVDRTGARNNDLTSPLVAESVWQVAREAGLRVVGSSHLPWFAELFPGGFDAFTQHVNHSENVFATALADVNVLHPLYVDEAAHHHGAASPEYDASVARADREIAGLLGAMNLDEDLVVLTADHGHRDAGGHGGSQPEIRNVLVCFAGKNVTKRADRLVFDGRNTAPLLSVMLGLRFPRHMRAGEDALDQIWDVPRARGASETRYLDDRREAVERFRAQNGSALALWLGSDPGTWQRLYAREAHSQWWRMALCALGFAAVTALFARWRRLPSSSMTAAMLFVALSMLAFWAAHRLVLGEFDYTVVNLRERFVPRASLAAMLGAGVMLALHRVQRRSLGEWQALLVFVLALNLGHIVVYGWPLGFPLPPAALRYFPFYGAFVLAVTAVVSGGLAIAMRFTRGRR